MTRPFAVLARSLRDFIRDDGITYAASLSYFFIVTIVPLCLFVVTVFGYVLGENLEFFEFFVSKLLGLFPEITKGITGELQKLITYKGIGVMGMALYAILASQFYMALNKSLQAIFKVQERRSRLRSFVLALIVATMVLGLLFLSFLLTSGVTVIKALEKYFPAVGIGRISAIMIRYVFPLLLVQFIAIAVYMIIPYRRVGFYSAFWGGLFTALMLEAAKHLFTLYVGSIREFGTIYGSLSTFVVFLLWVYYSAAIFLVGGEIVHNLAGDKRTTPSRRATDRSPE